MTVNEPLQVPNKVLPPGKYVMKLMDSPSNRHIVQIFDGDEQHLQTTVLAIPNYRLRPTGKTQFGFWETPPGQPKALRAWFYPGDNFGQEFAYPKSQSVVIAASAKAIVPTTYAENETDLATARVGTVNETGQEAPMQETTTVAETTTPAPAPAPEAERAAPAPEPAPAPAPQELPKTASPLMMIALAGLLSLGAFSMLRLARS
ncbi:MAG: hypothetical protein M3O35_02135 [Acidobacteriota bacterium]|nr:hypothetical protein [Acidobacteriota bacterium]